LIFLFNFAVDTFDIRGVNASIPDVIYPHNGHTVGIITAWLNNPIANTSIVDQIAKLAILPSEWKLR